MNSSPRIALICVLSTLYGCLRAPALAQDIGASDPNAPPVPTAPAANDGTQGLTLLNFLQAIAYDPGERGALLAIGPNQPFTVGRLQLPAGPIRRLALGTVARLFQRKASTVGSLTVLAPTTMRVIETNPGKADPLQGMKPADALKLLMGTFTPDQWQIASGENGIGFSDLMTDQTALFDRLLPTDIRVQKATVSGIADAGTVTFGNVEMVNVTDRSSVRVRFNREVSIGLHQTHANGVWEGGNALSYQPGETIVQLLPSRTYGAGDRGEDRASKAFGVVLMKTVANRQKPSDLDYASTALDARVPLKGLDTKSTVGQLIARVAAASHLQIVADFRVRDLPIFTLGDEARAGDVLQAIALGVTGTYRKVGPPATYLLTDDIEGIGARLTRLAYWAAQAEQQRFKLLLDAEARAVKQNPLAYLKFGAGDKLALAPDVQKKIDDRYVTNPYWGMPEQNAANLAPALRDEVNRDIELWRTQENVSLDPSKVTIGMRLSTCFVIPDVGIVKDAFASLSAGRVDLQELVAARDSTPNPPAKGSAASISTWLSAPSPRRILLVSPTTPAEATRLVGEARQRGFNEVWVRVALDGTPDAAAIVRAAQLPHTAPITAVVSLLHGGGAPGTPEKTILGQTGAEFAVDYVSGKSTDVLAVKGLEKADEKNRLVATHYSGWIQPSRGDLQRRISEIAAVPNLAGLAIDGTTPPGFAKSLNDYAELVLAGGELGYTDSRRLALIASKSLDPIDIRGKTLALSSVDLALPFFPDDSQSRQVTEINGKYIEDMSTLSPHEIWDAYLARETDTLLHDTYTNIRAAHPNLPLMIDDRTSDFVSSNNSWFGSWDSPTVLPKNDIYGEPAEAPALAHLSSKTILYKEAVPELDLTADPFAFAAFLTGISTSASSAWNGLIVDFTHVPFARTLELLGTIAAPGK